MTNMLAMTFDGWTIFWIALLAVVLILLLVMFNFIGLYVRAMVSGAHVTFADLVGMRIRNVNPLVIVNSRIQAMRAGLQVSSREMESHVLACHACIDRLEILDSHIANLKTALSQTEHERIQREATPKHRFWENWFALPSLSWAGAACAAIALALTITPHSSPLKIGEESSTQPTASVASATLSTYRDSQSVTIPRDRTLSLDLDASYIPQGRVDAELVTSTGRELWHGPAIVDSQEQTHISLNGISHPDTYFLRLYMPSAGDEHELLREYRFEVH